MRTLFVTSTPHNICLPAISDPLGCSTHNRQHQQKHQCFELPGTQQVQQTLTVLLQCNVTQAQPYASSVEFLSLAISMERSKETVTKQKYLKSRYTAGTLSKSIKLNKKPKASPRAQVRLERLSSKKLAGEVASISKPKTNAAEERQGLAVLMRFQKLVKTEGRQPVMNVDNLVLFIAHLSLAEYSPASIRIMLYNFKKYLPAEGVPEFSSPIVLRALKYRGSYRGTEDTRIPVTAAMLKEFEKIFDQDLPTYDAIAMKAVVWMAMFCMMRL